MRDAQEAARELVARIVAEHGQEAWIAEGYAAGGDLIDGVAALLRERDAEWKQAGNARFDQLCPALRWALEMMGRYEQRLIDLGDPPALVHSETHLAAAERARATLVSAGKLPFTAVEGAPPSPAEETSGVASLSPTCNPSSAGARWLFAQKEWLRRCGDTPRSRARFQTAVASIEGASDAELKRRLAGLKQRKLESPFERDLKVITGEILLIEGELAYRKPQALRGEAAYRSILAEKAIGPLMRAVGEKKAREILAETGRICAELHFKEGTDVDALIEELFTYRFPPKEPSDA